MHSLTLAGDHYQQKLHFTFDLEFPELGAKMNRLFLLMIYPASGVWLQEYTMNWYTVSHHIRLRFHTAITSTVLGVSLGLSLTRMCLTAFGAHVDNPRQTVLKILESGFPYSVKFLLYCHARQYSQVLGVGEQI